LTRGLARHVYAGPFPVASRETAPSL
jgi:hypothetical protein